MVRNCFQRAPSGNSGTSRGACTGRGLHGGGPSSGPSSTGRAQQARVKEARGGGRGAHCCGARRSGARVSGSSALGSPSCFSSRGPGCPLGPLGVRPPLARVRRSRTVPCAQWANLQGQLCRWSGAGLNGALRMRSSKFKQLFPEAGGRVRPGAAGVS